MSNPRTSSACQNVSRTIDRCKPEMTCILKSQDSEYPSFELKNGETLVIGRNRISKVKSSRVSRRQVEATLKAEQQIVEVKQIGPNDSVLNGKPIRMGLTVKAKEGDIIQLCRARDPKSPVSSFSYQVNFQGVPQVVPSPTGTKRRNPFSTFTDKEPKISRMATSFNISDQFRKDKDTLPSGIWESIKGDDFFVYAYGGSSVLESKPCVGAFDLDGTLIQTKSGRVFPKDEHDWKFRTSTTVAKLQGFFNKNHDFKFVIFTNQGGIKKPSHVPPFKHKIETIVRQIGIPGLVFVGTKKDEFRKPMTGGWDVFVRQFNEGIEPDLSKSFYCGDAAGRNGKPKDHSKGDRLFALNVGLQFKIPEEFFDGSKPPTHYPNPLFSPQDLFQNSSNLESNAVIRYPKEQEMILMVGYPASGKTSFVKSVLIPKGYVHVNRDSLKSMPKCVTVAQHALREGKSIVIDNTNPAKKDRESFIKLAKQNSCPVRCFRLMVDDSHALHNDKFRFLIGDLSSTIPRVAFNTYKATFQEPGTDEGFDEIVPVYFVPEFSNEARAKLYKKYLLDT